MGGAEMALYRLLAATSTRWPTEVVSLTDIGPVGEDIQRLGVPVSALGLRRGQPDVRGVLRLANRLRAKSPLVVQTWLYHADLIGGLAAAVAGRIPVSWGIHYSNFDPALTRRSTVWTATACARLSRWLPARIVCCSEASRQVHVELGYVAEKMVVIPNPVDLDAFRPDPQARIAVRQEVGVRQGTALIGMVARFDPQKDHRNFVLAASHLMGMFREVEFLLAGDAITWDNDDLAGWIRDAGLADRFRLLGRRRDVSRVIAALDVATLSSAYGEAYPNVVAEAMACTVPCVVTDVGDSAKMVGDTGRVVRARDPAALAKAWADLLKMGPAERARLGADARSRIRAEAEVSMVARRYERLYGEVASSHGSRRSP
jgi:glycosyltransferase involved in cell wall biosynthesis